MLYKSFSDIYLRSGSGSVSFGSKASTLNDVGDIESWVDPGAILFLCVERKNGELRIPS